MIEIKYHTRVFTDRKTNRVTIRVRWNNNETSFTLDCKADPDKWDSKSQRPMPSTIHKFKGQNYSARVISNIIDEGLDMIKVAFTKCELDSVVPSKEILKTMVRGEQPKPEIEPVKVKKTLSELYEEYQESKRNDRNLTKTSCYKFMQVWNPLIECNPGITLENLTKEKLNKLKNWYIDKGYSNSTITNRFKYLKSFFIWLRSEGHDLQPGVLAYKPNLTVISKTVTFLKHKELMSFYNYKFAENEKNLELVRDMFCFMAFTSIRYSDLENLKKANVFEDRIEICTKKTHDKLSIPLTIHAKEIINKYKSENYRNCKMFRVYANQKINKLLKRAAEKAGLDREVVLIHYNGNTRTEEVKKFHEVIGCHDARRTFVCCSLALGIPPTVVMSCTGHSTYNSMKPYIEVADETQRVELAKWDKAEKQNDIKGDIAKKLEDVDETTLMKVLELLRSA
jgi:integrase